MKKSVDFKKFLAEQKAIAKEKALADFQAAVPLFGGYSGLARRLKVSLSTCHGWARRESLPPWRAKEITVLLAKAAKPARGARRKKAA